MSVQALPLMGPLAWPLKPLDVAYSLIPHPAGTHSPPSSASTQGGLGSDVAAVRSPPATLPRLTRCIISGNNRTKPSLIGLEATVKRASGLGGWHWLVLPSGEEIKLQRNALQVIELGPEEAASGDSSEEEQEIEARASFGRAEILDRPRVRRPPRSLSPVPDMFKPPPGAAPRPSSSGGSGGSSAGRFHPYQPAAAPHPSKSSPTSAPGPRAAAAAAAASACEALNLMKLDTASLRRYRRVHQLGDVDASAPRDQLATAVSRHFRSQEVLDEGGVLLAFCAALRRRSSSGVCDV
ncbi:MAG: hypothetical protein J3K34DRAFT_66519 [Monoraphidium minutum]|nr:MAG: hypothetical protein J3K34DRAFT_66519 [Monoraphidium minutum]